MPRPRLLAALATLLLAPAAIAAQESPVDFNRDVRGILSQHCLKCHGRDDAQRQAELRLDRRSGATRRLASGRAAIVLGKPDQSELLSRVASGDPELRMPPADEGPPLTDSQVRTLERWIAAGAVYGRHWSFLAPRRHKPPATSPGWLTHNPIDNFIHARLSRAGLAPSPEADRETLIRRLSLDLRGLPPTPEEIDAFLADRTPGHWVRLVDRMLADPAYGERWSGMWLDLARYADSRGYGSDPLRPNAWRYRDWVIDAFNDNQPYDRFTTEQLAGDLLPGSTVAQKVATAFHRNTMTNTEGGTDDEEFRVAAVKDRVDTTLQAWMGLTIGCAKCHDHKYDPITQREYYRLFDIFNQTADSDRSDEAPVIEAPTRLMRDEVRGLDAAIAAIEAQRKALDPKIVAEKKEAATRPISARFVRLELPGKQRILSLAEVQIFVGKANVAIKGSARQSSTAFGGEAHLAIDGNTNGDYFKAKSTTHTKQEDHPWWEVDLKENFVVSQIIVFNRTDGGLFTRQSGLVVRLLDKDRKTAWEASGKSPPAAKLALPITAAGPAARQAQVLSDRLAALKKQRPKFPTLPVMQELPAEKRRTTHVMIRGSFLQKGPKVTAGFPAGFHAVAKGTPLTRLGVARWLTAADNPLTSRVAVNRFWGHLFGTGLVETEEDFGTQGEPPSHPRLLDWLATEFQRGDWDIKRLLRLIVTSATYRQSSRVTPAHLAIDPTNRLLARGPRFRLSAETIRDQALSIAGLLERRLGGPSVYPFQPKGLWQAAFNGQRKWPLSPGRQSYRRGLYTFWRRTVPYPSMSAFDAPSREICTTRRLRTNTPLQAFVMLNDPVYVEAAQALGRRISRHASPSEGQPDKANVAERVRYGFRLATGRRPIRAQVEAIVSLYESELAHYREHAEAALQVATQPLGPLPAKSDPATMAAWTIVASVLLNLDGVLTKG